VTLPLALLPTLPHLLARYRDVFRAAWAARHDLAGPRRLRDETAFLPAALCLQETPVHPAPRRTMWFIVALFTAAVVWSIVGRVDIVAVAPGRIVVTDHTKLVQPLEAGVVTAIHVKDGDRVAAGQALVDLDPTDAAADHGSVAEQLHAAREQAARAEALARALHEGGSPSVAAASPVDNGLLDAEWSDIRAQLARLDAELHRRHAELATATQLHDKLMHVLPLLRRREADFADLARSGFVAGHVGQDRARERIEAERDLSTQQARVTEAQAAITESRHKRTAYVTETLRRLNDRGADARLRAAQLAPQGAKAQHRRQRATLRAPVTGTVQQLAVHTTGGVVTPAQALMVIVPAEGDVTARVVVENKDIGFIHEAQPVEVKVESFPFTKYGTVPGTVTWVSRDAVIDEKTGKATFQATVRLSRREMDVDGRAVSLGPGFDVTAEIKTGRRRLIEFLTSPIARRVDESLVER
jgi:hemolysin D